MPFSKTCPPTPCTHRNKSSTTHPSCYVIFRILRPPFKVSAIFSCFIVVITVITHYPLTSQTSALWENGITGPIIWHTTWHFWYFCVSPETRNKYSRCRSFTLRTKNSTATTTKFMSFIIFLTITCIINILRYGVK